MTAATNTIKIHRVLRAPVDRVFKAFLCADAKCKWLPPHGFTGTMAHDDPRVGGSFRMAFTNFGTGNKHSFGGEYRQIVPNKLLQYTDRFEDPGLPGELLVTVTFRPVTGGTELHIVQEGVPAVIPPEMCYMGWQESLGQLAQLVEPTIPDAG